MHTPGVYFRQIDKIGDMFSLEGIDDQILPQFSTLNEDPQRILNFSTLLSSLRENGSPYSKVWGLLQPVFYRLHELSYDISPQSKILGPLTLSLS